MRFIQFGINHGLSQNSVHCIFRDSEGVVWIGTQDGLNKFDGKKITVYKPIENDSTSISDNFILHISEDKSGYIWISTRYGMNKLDKRTGKFIRLYAVESEKKQFQASYGKLLFYNQLPSLIRSDKLYVYNESLLKLESKRNISIPQGQLIQISASEFLVYHFQNGVYQSSNGLEGGFKKISSEAPINNTSFLLDANENYLVLANNKAVFIFDIKKQIWKKQNINSTAINHVTITSNNIIYIAAKEGLFVLNKNESPLLITNNTNSYLPPGAVLCTYEDTEKNLWVGTSGSGFLLYSPAFENFNLVTIPIKNDIVIAVAELNNKRWIATNSGLYCQNYLKDNPNIITVTSGKKITAITIDSAKKIWIGVEQEGLYVLNQSGIIEKKYSIYNSILKSNLILHLSTDKKGAVLISSEKNFYKSTNGIWQEVSNVITKSFYVLHAFNDSKGNIWLSTNAGVFCYDSSLKNKLILESTTESSPIKRTLITCCTEDNNGAIWIATISKGIYTYYNNKLHRYTASDGLSSDVVYSLVCDKQNRVWATTSNGLHLFDNKLMRFVRLSTFDGLIETAFNIGGMTTSNIGNILVGTSDGLLVCNPDNIIIKSNPLFAKITDIKLNGTSVDSIGKKIMIQQDTKSTTFEFGVSESFQTGTVFYQYKLDSNDKEWILLPTGINNITINNIEYGKSVFVVRAATSVNGLQNAPIYSMQLNNLAPFWKSNWFKFLVLLALVGIVALVVNQINNRKLEKQQQLLKTQKELQIERERIGRDLHDNIGAYTAALIAGLNQVKVLDALEDEKVTDLKDYASNILTYLRETIWVLNNQELDITAFYDRFKNYAQKIGKSYPLVKLHFFDCIENNKTLPPQIMLSLFRILQEALQNAYKHSNANNIYITIESKKKLLAKIVDDGIGIVENEKNEGYGLLNMKARAGEIGFTLLTDTKKNEGTTISILENTAYDG